LNEYTTNTNIFAHLNIFNVISSRRWMD